MKVKIWMDFKGTRYWLRKQGFYFWGEKENATVFDKNAAVAYIKTLNAEALKHSTGKAFGVEVVGKRIK